MAIKKTPNKNSSNEQADLFSNSGQMNIVELEDAPAISKPSGNGPKDPHDPNTV